MSRTMDVSRRRGQKNAATARWKPDRRQDGIAPDSEVSVAF